MTTSETTRQDQRLASQTMTTANPTKLAVKLPDSTFQQIFAAISGDT